MSKRNSRVSLRTRPCKLHASSLHILLLTKPLIGHSHSMNPVTDRYLSLRLDGRVRGSGVGYPPWNAFVLQLPPAKGMWLGLLDGMDGRVL